jgi:hypothetical protein
MKYRKKPVVIDAMLFTGGPDSFHDIFKGLGAVDEQMLYATDVNGQNPEMVISTLEGEMTAKPGDWIIKGVKGEFYPCKPDIFAATYDPA